MSAKVNPIPPGFHTFTPYLLMPKAADAIDFYQRAFNAVERCRIDGPKPGSVGHAEITIGNSIIMLADEPPCAGPKSPQTLGGTSANFVLYVEDCDASFQQAVAAGATEFQPLKDQFYGDRSGCVKDPFGYYWTLMTHKEDVPPEEMKRRIAKFMSDLPKPK
jgi:PhnB protein